MTVEEALKINQKWTHEQAKNDLERLLLRGERPANKVVALACMALDKQIPMKVVYYDDGDYARCPHCGGKEFENGINDWQCNFCSRCGQAIHWRDEE